MKHRSSQRFVTMLALIAPFALSGSSPAISTVSGSFMDPLECSGSPPWGYHSSICECTALNPFTGKKQTLQQDYTPSGTKDVWLEMFRSWYLGPTSFDTGDGSFIEGEDVWPWPETDEADYATLEFQPDDFTCEWKQVEPD